MGFSVVVPTYNRMELLKETLQSLWQQTYTSFEVIVVNDGSTDGTSDFLKTLEGRVRNFTQPNRGPGAARNLGAAHAHAEYLAFLDSDDLWFPWTLQAYHQAIEETARPSFVAGRPYRFWVDRELSQVQHTSLSLQQFPDYLASSDKWRWWGASSFVIKNDAFRRTGGFSDRRVNGEDADLALCLGTAPGFVQIEAPATFAYREHEMSATKDLRRTIDGAWLKVRREQSGGYPGGRSRSSERRRILTRHTRPITLDCLKQELLRDAWKLYRATFAWNTAERRGAYLMGFPLLAAAAQLRALAGRRS